MAFIINLVEDEQSLREILASYLKREPYEVRCFSDGESALKVIPLRTDLWILDITLPGCDGFELLQKIREKNRDVPIIFISARDRDIDRVVGLEVGADDYLAKPFLPRELVIRVKKRLNLIYKDSLEGDSPSSEIRFGSYILFKESRELHYCGEKSDLTTKEFDLLRIFAENKGQAFSREQLISRIWGDGYYSSERVVDDLIRRLRGKLADLPIETIYGYGYRMVEK